MHNMTAAQAEQPLTGLADQFAHWRQQRTYRFAPIPLPLWEQAIALTAVLPLASVAKRLGVRGRDLHKRCAARPEGPGAEPGPAALDFVEVPAASSWTHPAPPTEIELHRAPGARPLPRFHRAELSLPVLVRAFSERHSSSSARPKAASFSPRRRWIFAKASMASRPCAARCAAITRWRAPSTSSVTARARP